ncbi:hypothetical protein BJ508DRAFT_303269 [Ascobolus immersus RN42]|uniref:Uncharacterized protein n=1 Tax=Ascobolus immersus RN42 TaxID=1160509 RepID=A0A3N4IGC6_ASCIM|nr:hypothetical protein BJ508DRAFT_303269 [Ascobolus immersus RN42]
MRNFMLEKRWDGGVGDRKGMNKMSWFIQNVANTKNNTAARPLYDKMQVRLRVSPGIVLMLEQSKMGTIRQTLMAEGRIVPVKGGTRFLTEDTYHKELLRKSLKYLKENSMEVEAGGIIKRSLGPAGSAKVAEVLGKEVGSTGQAQAAIRLEDELTPEPEGNAGSEDEYEMLQERETPEQGGQSTGRRERRGFNSLFSPTPPTEVKPNHPSQQPTGFPAIGARPQAPTPSQSVVRSPATRTGVSFSTQIPRTQAKPSAPASKRSTPAPRHRTGATSNQMEESVDDDFAIIERLIDLQNATRHQTRQQTTRADQTEPKTIPDVRKHAHPCNPRAQLADSSAFAAGTTTTIFEKKFTKAYTLQSNMSGI